MKNKQNRSQKKLFILVALPVVVIALTAIALELTGVTHLVLKISSDNTPVAPAGTVNLSPATPADKQANDAHKQDLAEDQKTADQPTQSQSTTKVNPVISYADRSEVSAFVPDIAENGGTCTLTLTHNSATITKTSDAIADASTTRCRNFTLTSSDVSSAGSWQAVVSYSSTKSSGSSAPASFEVQ